MMLATVLIDPPTTLFGGAILALISMKLARRSLDEVWRVGQLAAAWGLVYGISVGWHFFYRTDWMFFYAMDTTGLPLVPFFGLFLFVCAAWGGLGGLSVAALLHVKKTGLAWAAFAGAILGFAMLLFVTVDQYKHVGSRAEYLAGTARSVTDDANWVLASNVSPVIFGVAAVVIIALQVRKMRAP